MFPVECYLDLLWSSSWLVASPATNTGNWAALLWHCLWTVRRKLHVSSKCHWREWRDMENSFFPEACWIFFMLATVFVCLWWRPCFWTFVFQLNCKGHGPTYCNCSALAQQYDSRVISVAPFPRAVVAYWLRTLFCCLGLVYIPNILVGLDRVQHYMLLF